MAVKVEERNGRLCYRLCFDGWKGHESTGCRATAKNRERLERKARVMSDLMAEGRFNYASGSACAKAARFAWTLATTAK